MNQLKYAIIGKNWGNRIDRILKDLGKNSQIVNVRYRDLKFQEYQNEIKQFINKNKINVVWLAIPPVNQFEICRCIINSNSHVIVEKPMILNVTQKQILYNLLENTKKKLAVHFQYLFLEQLLNFNYEFDFDNIEFIFNHSKQQGKLKPEVDLGIHMIAIKKLYFNNINNIKLLTSFNSKDERIINFKIKNKIIHTINFTNSKQKIIQVFINYFENKVLKNIENKINLKFAFDAYKELNNIMIDNV